jgi:ABC-2 type transport system ATP-binding protein
VGSRGSVRVRTPQPEELSRLVAAAGGSVSVEGDGVVVVSGLGAGRISELAFENAVRLAELVTVQASLEEAFVELTAQSVEFHAHPSEQPTARKGSS